MRPTVSQALAWRPEALHGLADGWDAGALALAQSMRDAGFGVGFWSGPAAEAARRRGDQVAGDGAAVARSLRMGAAAVRGGAARIAVSRAGVLALVSAAREAGFGVADDGSVHPPGGRIAPADAQAAVGLTVRLGAALDRLGEDDADTVRRIEAVFSDTRPAGVWPVPAAAGVADAVAGWPRMSQDDIARQIAAMTSDQRGRLIAEFPRQVGNTDGVPWAMRFEANRLNIAAAIAASGDSADGRRRAEFYRTLLCEVDDPAGAGRRVRRQILAFDPARASLVELHGHLASATSVAVFVPGLNTTIEGSQANVETARRFVRASGGDVAAITYLGGPFPHGNLLTGPADAANPRYALDMAPRLVAFSEDVDRTVDGTGRAVAVTYVGHSYGGSIVGTAETLGLTADRVLYVAAAGAGVGVDDPGDWHNRNPHVIRFSMTAPGDFIEAVQGVPGGPHGADPDDMPGVVRLPTGRYDDGGPVAGWPAHSDILNRPSDAWRNILAVITGDSATLHKAG